MKRPEQEIQKACVNYLRWLERLTGKITFFHPANGIRTTAKQAAIFKSIGMRAGVPDLVIAVEGGKTLWFELKTKGGRLSANQKDFHDGLRRLGHHIEVIEAERPIDAVGAIACTLRRNGVEEAR